METTYTIIQIVSATHALRFKMHQHGHFVGHLSVRVGMREEDSDEAMGTGALPVRPQFKDDLAFVGADGGLLFYKVSLKAGWTATD